MKRVLIGLIQLFAVLTFSLAYGAEWWKSWDYFPNVPRITAQEVKALSLAGEKVAFVYAGYAVSEVVCGSLVIPYTLVPPNGDGSKVHFSLPLDYLIVCY